jgi:aryl sulfotransferase
MASIVWLASYPKSGNTWVRVFLTNYRRASDVPADINELEDGPIASARYTFDEFTGVKASDLTPEEIERCRPQVYRHLAAESRETLFVKVHDAFTWTDASEPLFPPDVTAGVLYILRNPLDVAVSFAHHSGMAVESIVSRMCWEVCTLNNHPGRLHEQLPQKLLSWSDHVRSWVDASGLRVHVVRYEDMVGDPLATFTAIVQFVGLMVEPLRVATALGFSRFDQLQLQERDKGFKERWPKATSFFRKGLVGDWRNALTPEHVRRLIDAHSVVMRRFAYLTDDGVPVY